MEELNLLRDLIILFGLAILVVVACYHIRVPSLVGFLITGVVAGPSGLRLIHDARSVDLLASIGVVLLLFTVGIDFSIEKLVRIRKVIFVGGGLQVLLTVVPLVLIMTFALAFPFPAALLFGVLVAFSSTAIVLKVLNDRVEIDSPPGRISLGICIFQDLCVVPTMIAIPFLAGKGGDTGEIVLTVAKAMGMVIGALAVGQYFVPWALRHVVRTRNREAFLLVIVIFCLGTAWLSALAGLSLALGAFIAGLVISQSEYSHEALGEMIPFRDVFSSLFFISIGMLLDVRSFADPYLVSSIVIGVIALKAIVAAGVTLIIGYTLRIAIVAGFLLAQIGEFSFVLAQSGRETNLLDAHTYQIFLAAAVLSMTLTPFLRAIAPALADIADRHLPERLRLGRTFNEVPEEAKGPRDHVIVVGYGLNGRNLVRGLTQVSIPYVVIEMNPETVAAERRKGEPILYGDASNPEVLKHAGIAGARVLVIAVSDPSSIRRATALARRLNPAVHIIVRTRYLPEMAPLLELGADEVVPEEFETSLEIFARTLRKLLVPRDVVDRFIREARTNSYGLLRSGQRLELQAGQDERPMVAGADMEVLRVEPSSPLAGKTLQESNLRRATGATILALKRGDEFHCNPPTSARLEAGSVAIVFGTPEQVAAAAGLFRGAVEQKS